MSFQEIFHFHSLILQLRKLGSREVKSVGGKWKKKNKAQLGELIQFGDTQAKPVFRVLFTPMLEDKYKWSFIATQQWEN